jgi:hypothetical protein
MGVPEEEIETAYREMPDFVKRGLIRVNGGQMYLTAPYRVLWMRSEHKDWGIVTSVEYADYEKGFAVVRAVIMDGDGRVMATAHSEESRGKLPYLKKAETAAIARALALCGYGTQFGELEDEEGGEAASGDSMGGTGRNGGGATGALWNGPGACPSCRAPAGKKHASGCKA